MSEIKHTPGPWKKCGGATPEYTAIHSGDGYVVFRMADGFHDREHGKPIQTPDLLTQAANAHLIASAPDLLRQRDELQKIDTMLVELLLKESLWPMLDLNEMKEVRRAATAIANVEATP